MLRGLDRATVRSLSHLNGEPRLGQSLKNRSSTGARALGSTTCVWSSNLTGRRTVAEGARTRASVALPDRQSDGSITANSYTCSKPLILHRPAAAGSELRDASRRSEAEITESPGENPGEKGS